MRGMYFKSIFFLNILQHKFIYDFRFRLIFLCPFHKIIPWFFFLHLLKIQSSHWYGYLVICGTKVQWSPHEYKIKTYPHKITGNMNNFLLYKYRSCISFPTKILCIVKKPFSYNTSFFLYTFLHRFNIVDTKNWLSVLIKRYFLFTLGVKIAFLIPFWSVLICPFKPVTLSFCI